MAWLVDDGSRLAALAAIDAAALGAKRDAGMEAVIARIGSNPKVKLYQVLDGVKYERFVATLSGSLTSNSSGVLTNPTYSGAGSTQVASQLSEGQWFVRIEKATDPAIAIHGAVPADATISTNLTGTITVTLPSLGLVMDEVNDTTTPSGGGIASSSPLWKIRVNAREALSAIGPRVVTQFYETGPLLMQPGTDYPSNSIATTSNTWGIRHPDGTSWIEKKTAPDGKAAFCYRLKNGMPGSIGAGTPERCRAEILGNVDGFRDSPQVMTYPEALLLPGTTADSAFWIVLDYWFDSDMLAAGALAADVDGIWLHDHHDSYQGSLMIRTASGGLMWRQAAAQLNPPTRTWYTNDASNGINENYVLQESTTSPSAWGDQVHYTLVSQLQASTWYTIIFRFSNYSPTTGARTEIWRAINDGAPLKLVDNTRRNTHPAGSEYGGYRFPKMGLHKGDRLVWGGVNTRTLYSRGWYIIKDDPSITVEKLQAQLVSG